MLHATEPRVMPRCLWLTIAARKSILTVSHREALRRNDNYGGQELSGPKQR